MRFRMKIHYTTGFPPMTLTDPVPRSKMSQYLKIYTGDAVARIELIPIPEEAKKASKNVRKDYLDDLQYLKSLEGTQKRGTDMSEQDQLAKNSAKSNHVISDEPAELVKGLVRQGAYEIAKSFIDFLAKKNEEPKKESKTMSKKQTEN